MLVAGASSASRVRSSSSPESSSVFFTNLAFRASISLSSSSSAKFGTPFIPCATLSPAVSASSYSFVSMVQHFGPLMNKGGAAISLTYLASERVIPGYGGGMSSAKAALESDTQVLAFEAGRKYGMRVNTISAGPLGSRAARAIGFIDDMINYSVANAPMEKELGANEVANVAAFLCSPLASAITGSCIYVDNGLNTMGLAMDSKALERDE